MGFDFDDLEEVAPAGLPELSVMSDEDFEGFRALIAKAEREQRYAEFSNLVGSAIWDEELLPKRMPKIVDAFTSLLDEVTSRRMPDLGSGSAIVYTMWMMGLSTSLHEVRVRKGDGPAVLVLGFGGSDVADLEFHADYYEKKGFTVITTSRTTTPLKLAQKQDYTVVQELKSALTPGRKFVLHMNSQHGLIYGSSILNRWIDKEVPFDILPPITDHLQAFVIDSGAPSKIDPEKKILLYPTSLEEVEQVKAAIAEADKDAQEEGEEAEDLGPENDSQLIKNQTKFFRSVMLGCTGAMSKKWGLKSIEEMVLKNKEISKTFLLAARITVVPTPWRDKMFGTDKIGLEADPWFMLQMADWKLPPMPRLFLYSKEDMLITREMMEIYIRHTKKYRPEAKVFEKMTLKSAHCKNWETEPELCGEAASNFFEATSVL